MIIDIKLSTESINRAIRMLKDADFNIEYGLQQTVDMLAKEGAMIAQSAYGGMASVDHDSYGDTAVIRTSGKANIIAEFGAGDATEVPTGFENLPSTPVYPGSYSESEEGSGMYVKYGWWKFGGKVYTQVEPRNGLMRAKAHIVSTAEDMAKEVIKL